MKIAVVTKIPSPYQIELFDAVHASPHGLQLSVAYVRRRDPDRSWADRRLQHEALFLDAGGSASEWIDRADLAVFSWYRDPGVRALIARRAASGKPWAFWGERPGFRNKGLLGMGYRRWRLWPLWRDARVPIWGIGRWAIEGYRQEFGAARPYFHVPYVSDLSAFFALPEAPPAARKTVVYSGSLTERKGVRELVQAFDAVSRRRSDVQLRILGSGPLEAELRRKLSGNAAASFVGFQDWDQVAAHYAEADLLCAPSHHDGWGLIVPEAMAAGMPVVASTAVGSAREMVAEGETGWLVPPRDAAALAAKIDLALSLDGAALARMRARCREAARDYTVAAGVERFAAAARASVGHWR